VNTAESRNIVDETTVLTGARADRGTIIVDVARNRVCGRQSELSCFRVPHKDPALARLTRTQFGDQLRRSSEDKPDLGHQLGQQSPTADYPPGTPATLEGATPPGFSRTIAHFCLQRAIVHNPEMHPVAARY
jgi:hypothetical protein